MPDGALQSAGSPAAEIFSRCVRDGITTLLTAGARSHSAFLRTHLALVRSVTITIILLPPLAGALVMVVVVVIVASPFARTANR